MGKQFILPVANRDSVPLSFAQQRLWFLDQLEPNNHVYHVPRAVRLTGKLNVGALQNSLDAIVDRHEALRTNFVGCNSGSVQIVNESRPVELTITDLSKLGRSECETEVQRLLTAEIERPFNLSVDLMLRARLLRLSHDEHVLLLVMHHIAADGWSVNVVFRELTALYNSYCTGMPCFLPALPIQYVDYTVWQRELLQGDELRRQLSYWKERLNGAPSLLELPTDRPRRAVQAYRGEQQSLILVTSLVEALKKLSRSEGTTLFMTMLAAWQSLLYRLTGQQDILIGSPVAGRKYVELEGLIGFFVNTLVFRGDLSGNPAFKEVLARVRKLALEAYQHQDLPFERLVEEMHPDRNLSHSPLCQVMFGYQNFPKRAVDLTGLTLTPIDVDSKIAKFDLTLSIEDSADTLKIRLEYNTDLFDALTITRMLGHFQTLLEGIIADPDQRISDLPMLTEAEKRQLLIEWNDTKTDYPRDKCIHQLFEEQVGRTPDATAVVFEDQRLTYRELNQRANQLAHYLLKLEVGPEVLVGICMERSLEMIIGLLGILKAGGAYVPLDPDYPKERLAFMLDDTQAPVLLTQQRLVETLPEHNAHVVCVDREWKEIAKEAEESPDTKVTAENLAYVIYTSGSTGRCKGVLISHYNVVRLFQATHSWFNFGGNDVWTLFHSCAFDFSVWEIWGGLLHGGRLVIVPYEVSRSPGVFYELLHKEKVTVLNQTPSAFRQLNQFEQSLCSPPDLSLRLVIFGGEALDFQSLRPWFERHGDRFPQLVNMYGITETTVHVTYRPISQGDLSATAGSLIGVPIPDVELYVLDQNQTPVPIGVPGEIYVGGSGVGRGYLNRAQLTAERFISNPFRYGTSNLYRSGDLARFLPYGDIEYLGRIDTQIKIRGYRIELGEIESVLDQHPAVRKTVVVAREDVPGDKRLFAYIIAVPEQCPTIDDLNNFLRAKLPGYMVPSKFVFLDSLPLTPNGKVDRTALPIPDQTRPELVGVYLAPRTQVEKLVAAIWAEVLGLEKVSIRDNFFDLGGHSLLATQVISRVRAAFNLKLSLRVLLENPTVASIAVQITEAQAKRTTPRKIADVVVDLESLSEEEAQEFLARRGNENCQSPLEVKVSRIMPAARE